MKFQRILPFALISIGAGLLAALLALNLIQSDEPEATPAPQQPAVVYRGEPVKTVPGPASYADAVAHAAPAVVNIYTAKVLVERSNPLFNDPVFQHFFGNRLGEPRKRLQTSLGSGVIISSDGLILTNHHVIADADEIQVVLSDGRTVHAQVIGSDPDTDIALLRTKEKGLPAVTLGNSAPLRVGDVVLAIGNPFGVGQTVTMGIVSATGRNQLGINTFENFIQTDAAINPGNSGGALVNAEGELIGINTAIFSKSGGSQGIGFAIPIDLAGEVMNQLLANGRVVRGWFGIAGQDITPELARSFGLKETKGVLVSAVQEQGPADKAGIHPGDVITTIGEQHPQDSHEILNLIAHLQPGVTVKVEGWRGQAPFQTAVVVSERPQQTEGN